MADPVSFLSDFGLDDEFVGVVHGVVARISPSSQIIDVTHGIPAGDVRGGALALTRAVQYLPPGVILAVVDPGVGSQRRAIAAATGFGFFVGPDNGLLSPAVTMVGGATSMVSIESPEVIIPSPGATFHGRDVFAPAAALLAAGEAKLEELGPPIEPETAVPLMLPLPRVEPPEVSGEVWWIDRFGNAETNIGPDDLGLAGGRPGGEVQLRAGVDVYRVSWVDTYASVSEGSLLLHVDSAGLMALAVRGGRADDHLGIKESSAVSFRVG